MGLFRIISSGSNADTRLYRKEKILTSQFGLGVTGRGLFGSALDTPLGMLCGGRRVETCLPEGPDKPVTRVQRQGRSCMTNAYLRS